jgi:hypothetical protein
MFAGLQKILDRMPCVKGIHLDEAMELCHEFFSGVVTYPFKEKTLKRRRAEEEPVAGTSGASDATGKKNKKEGKHIPKDDKNLRKYCLKNMPETVKRLLLKHVQELEIFDQSPELSAECVEIIANSLAKRTWDKYNSALNLWEKFTENFEVKNFSGLAFTCWCKKNTNLKSATIKSYLGILRKLKFLLGFKKGNSSNLEKIILRGVENMENKVRENPVKVLPMTLNLLQEINKGLNMAICSSCSKQSIWACSVTAFWSLARLGEILPTSAERFDKTSTLLWKDVKFGKDNVTLYLNAPKTRSKQSKIVCLFDIKEKLFCPVTQLKKLKQALIKRKIWNENLPVFLRSSGKSLTKTSFVKAINISLSVNHASKYKIQGKSFRSGIPTFLGNQEDDKSERTLKTLGRWKGDSFHCYIRNPARKNRLIFDQVAAKILNDFLYRQKNLETSPGSGEQ